MSWESAKGTLKKSSFPPTAQLVSLSYFFSFLYYYFSGVKLIKSLIISGVII